MWGNSLSSSFGASCMNGVKDDVLVPRSSIIYFSYLGIGVVASKLFAHSLLSKFSSVFISEWMMHASNGQWWSLLLKYFGRHFVIYVDIITFIIIGWVLHCLEDVE